MACCSNCIKSTKAKTLGGKWSEFKQNTTAHGISIVGDAESSRCRRVIYGLAFLSLSAWILQLPLTLIQLTSEDYADTRVSVDSTVHELPFPALTICNFNPYKASYVKKNRTDSITATAVEELMDSTYGDLLTSRNFSSAENYDFKDVNISEIFEDAAHSVDETLIDCTFNGVSEDCSALFNPVLTDLGICYRFSGGKENGRLVRERGRRYGLTVYLFVNSHEYTVGQTQDAGGFKVLIHDPKEPAMMQSSGFAIMPGTETFVAVTKEKFHETRLSKCAWTSSYNPFANNKKETYTPTACKQAALSICAVEQCGCKPFNYPGNYSSCNRPSDIICSRRAVENCMLNDSKRVADREECLDLCHQNNFHVALSYAEFPSPKYMTWVRKQYQWSESYTRSNLLKLNIYYETLVVKTVMQEAYSMVTFVGNLGGQLGFCLGASFITVMEILEFLADVILSSICKMFKSLRAPLTNRSPTTNK